MEKAAKPDAINQRFARVLRELRRRKGISQERLALEVSLDRTFISMLERGIRQPTLKTLFAISKVLGLGVPAHEIIRAVECNDKLDSLLSG